MTRRLRRRIAADGRAKARSAWHLSLASAAFSFGWALFEWGNWERAAARAGDRQVLKVRHAIREALQFPDAVSVLEHALSGIGMAAFGMAILQVYYCAYQPAADNESTFPRWGRALLFLLIASAAAAFAWPMTYGHTGPLVVPVGLLVIGWWLARPDQLSRLALNTPGRFIALVGWLAWLNFDLGWKLQQWPTTHDTFGVVLAHLGASAGMLIACSAAVGAGVGAARGCGRCPGETNNVRATPARALLRLTPAHFALYRAYLEGLDEATLHAHYGVPGTDVRVTRRTLATLRDTLTIAARRARDIDAAHLLRLKPGSLPRDAHAGAAAGREVPTLEGFRAEVDPDAFYSERELVALYVETYPPASSPALDRKVARNRRLRERQDAALARMEASLVEAPQPEHTLDGWFDARLVARLTAAGVTTFADLIALMRARRQRWYRAVPRLGAIGAQRISDFIAQHPDTLGYLSPLAVTPRRQLVAGHPALQPVPGAGVGLGGDVVPLEALRVPAALDGSAGLNRAPVPAHQAELNTDLQAVNAWIATRGARSEATRRAYRREAERLLLWAIVVKGKPLSSLNTMDCAEYLDGLLRNPQPAERWIGRGRVERFDPAWRPFVGPLSERSRDTARRILNAMGAWLIGQQYLSVNPFGGLPAAPAVQLDTTGRTLTRAQWQYVLQTVLRPVPAFTVRISANVISDFG
ncbi:phage integrase family protein [Burkholderia cenocepacia]|uniref:phage integrase family protein n=1 Tax=Burkholderia cenocepacia TaxID=95486 RepID=UPI0025B76890|nr:phage integrase family protein [Burkholderia cenocepacia]